MTDGIGTSRYTYDSLDRLKSVTNYITGTPGITRTVTYTYDNASRLTSLAYPDIGHGVHTVSRGYDEANQLTAVTDWLSPTHTTSFGYDKNGNLSRITYPNNVTSTFG